MQSRFLCQLLVVLIVEEIEITCLAVQWEHWGMQSMPQSWHSRMLQLLPAAFLLSVVVNSALLGGFQSPSQATCV